MSETLFHTDADRQYATDLLDDLDIKAVGPQLEIATQWFCKARVENALAAVAATAVRDATEAMALAGARSIGNTIHTDNHGVRARECWRAMWDARDGIVEPIPQGTLVSRPMQAPGGAE